MTGGGEVGVGRDRAARYLSLLQDLIERAGEHESLFDLLRQAITDLCQELGWSRGRIRVLEDRAGLYAGDEVWFLADTERPWNASDEAQTAWLPDPGEALTQAVQRARALVLLDPIERDRPAASATEAEPPSVACGFPIRIGAEVWAVGEVYGGPEARVDEGARALLSQVGLQLGQVIERAEAERQLRLSEAYFRRLIEHAFDLLLVLDEEGNIRYASPPTVRALGGEGRALIGRPMTEHLRPRQPERWAGLLRGEEGDGPLAVELALARDAGPPRRLDAQLRRMLEDPAVGGIVINARDVTWRARAEAALRRARRGLAQRAEEERLFLAQELHDGPIQALSGALYGLRGLVDGLQDLPSATRAARVERDLARVIAQLRAVCQSLRPSTLMTFGLRAALRSEAEAFREKHPDIELELVLDEEAPQLGRELRLALFRITQQALANVAQHAGARRVELRLDVREGCFRLEVRDDGRGFEMPDALSDLARDGHLGLVGMRERAESVGAELSIESAPGRGTRLSVRGPIQAGEASEA